TQGCSGACPDCGVAAPYPVSDIIPFSLLDELFSKYRDDFQGFLPYFASDPFDYDDGEHSYLDVHHLIERNLRTNSTIVTNIPPGKEKEIWKLIFSGNSSYGSETTSKQQLINALSLTDMNAGRVLRTLESMIPQLEGDQEIVASHFVLQECYDASTWSENGLTTYYGKSERHVLSNTHEILEQLGVDNLNDVHVCGYNPEARLAKDQDALTPKGLTSQVGFWLKYGREPTDIEIEEIRERNKFRKKTIEENVPRQITLPKEAQLHERGQLYFVRLPNGHVLGNTESPVTTEDVLTYLKIRDRQLLYELDCSHYGVMIRDFRGCGVHSKTLGPENLNNLADSGIGCFHGVLMTPNGFFSYQTRKPTRKYPFGSRLEQITPSEFQVPKLKWIAFKDSLHVAKSFSYV
ncbi:hypothetical protein GOV11_04400, partial [Candidatus Woesearchaeota archaeon]|nr:hypothetical protein [Candidatus Woesearchaeota archaeon]